MRNPSRKSGTTYQKLANVLRLELNWKFLMIVIFIPIMHEARFDSGSWHSKQSLRITTIFLDTSTRLLTSFSKHHKIY